VESEVSCSSSGNFQGSDKPFRFTFRTSTESFCARTGKICCFYTVCCFPEDCAELPQLSVPRRKFSEAQVLPSAGVRSFPLNFPLAKLSAALSATFRYFLRKVCLLTPLPPLRGAGSLRGREEARPEGGAEKELLQAEEGRVDRAL